MKANRKLFEAQPDDYRGDPSHVFINLSGTAPYEYYPYYLQGAGYLHVANDDKDFSFDSMMKIGGKIEYLEPTEEPDFAKVDIAFNKHRRSWMIGGLRSGGRAIYCKLPHGHGIMLQV